MKLPTWKTLASAQDDQQEAEQTALEKELRSLEHGLKHEIENREARRFASVRIDDITNSLMDRASSKMANKRTNMAFMDLVYASIEEAERAMVRYPSPNYSLLKFAEEAGEVVKDAIHVVEGREEMSSLRGEIKQAIAMLYRLWLEGDETIKLPPVSGFPSATSSSRQAAAGGDQPTFEQAVFKLSALSVDQTQPEQDRRGYRNAVDYLHMMKKHAEPCPCTSGFSSNDRCLNCGKPKQ